MTNIEKTKIPILFTLLLPCMLLASCAITQVITDPLKNNPRIVFRDLTTLPESPEVLVSNQTQSVKSAKEALKKASPVIQSKELSVSNTPNVVTSNTLIYQTQKEKNHEKSQ